MGVAALAGEIGCSRRHLAARFRDEVGLPPEAHGAHRSLAGIAAASGFHDQAHLNREVRAPAGLTPRELTARRLPGSGGLAGA